MPASRRNRLRGTPLLRLQLAVIGFEQGVKYLVQASPGGIALQDLTLGPHQLGDQPGKLLAAWREVHLQVDTAAERMRLQAGDAQPGREVHGCRG